MVQKNLGAVYFLTAPIYHPQRSLKISAKVQEKVCEYLPALNAERRIYRHDLVVLFAFEVFSGEEIHLCNLLQRT